MLRPVLLFCCLTMPALAATTTIHRWVDAQGVVHFSDQPTGAPGSETITVATPAKTQSVAPQPSTSSTPTATSQTAPVGSIRLVSPANDTQVRENTGRVAIEAEINPLPTDGYYLKVLLDGAVVQQVADSMQTELVNVDRGTHQLELQLLDKNGKLLASSGTSTFHLMRISVLTRPNKS